MTPPPPRRCSLCDRHMRWLGVLLVCVRCDHFDRALTYAQRGAVK